jgi:hypothetical protein
MRSGRSVGALLACAGCLQITPIDGALHCSTVGDQCPPGYWCASDQTCWHLGKTPPTPTLDMSIAPGDDMLMQSMETSCMTPSDCPATPSWCLLVGCIGGTCALVAQPQGTILPDNLQVAHDCQKLRCNATGQAESIADPSDTPLDPSGGCNTPSCNGGAVTLAPTAIGTACTAVQSGICNGKGVCGVCRPGNVYCSSNIQLQICAPDGSAWVNQATCQSCSNTPVPGNCVAPCDATKFPQCNGNTLVTCVGGMTKNQGCANGCCASGGVAPACNASATCSNGVALGGAKCDGTQTTILSCPTCGGSGASASCAGNGNGSDCLDTGDGKGPHCVPCLPGATQCCAPSGQTSAVGNQQCDPSGHWGACTICPVAAGATPTCSGNGSCGCSARNPCTGLNCGQINDLCGQPQSCDCTDPNRDCNFTSHHCVISTNCTNRVCK